MNIAQTRQILSKHGLSTAKSLGQNFLIDDSVCSRIAESAGIDEQTHVFEIGPGIGAMTEKLCAAAGFVTAIELDKRLPDALRDVLRAYQNYEIVRDDALKADFGGLIKPRYAKHIVCANLPYNITSPIIAKILESGLFDSATVMIQREVADRLSSKPGTAEYGAFTLFVQYHAAITKHFDVPPSAFLPPPKVTSSVVTLTPTAAPDLAGRGTDYKVLFRTIKAAFAQRRKTLINALSSGFSELSKDAIREIIINTGRNENIRGETLSLDEFITLSAALKYALSKGKL